MADTCDYCGKAAEVEISTTYVGTVPLQVVPPEKRCSRCHELLAALHTANEAHLGLEALDRLTEEARPLTPKTPEEAALVEAEGGYQCDD